MNWQRTARGWPARAAAGLTGLLLVVVLVPLMAAASIFSSGSVVGLPSVAAGPHGIPEVYVPLYRAAGGAFGVSWLLIAAVHQQESDFSRSMLPGVRAGANGCGAAGPMQFGIVGLAPYHATAPSCGSLTGTGAGDTWARYDLAFRRLPLEARNARYPLARSELAGCTGVSQRAGCVYDDTDAIAAAAAFLHTLGARRSLDNRAWEAARHYNGTAAYADVVLTRARDWQATLADDLGSLDVPLISGARAQLAANGLARAPADTPPEVAGAIAAANAISDRPYQLIHYPTHIANPTYDCSSSTSHVLWGAHAFGTAPWVASQLMRYGEPGPGRWITVYANDGHVFLTVAGLRFDTSRYDTGPNAQESGPRWRLGPRPTANFVIRHPPGL